MAWTALSLVAPQRATVPRPVRRLAFAATALVFLMVLTGGLVAGIRAGFAYNTFPLMNGHVVPPEILMLEPAWQNLFFNMATVQFDHRLAALIVAVALDGPWWSAPQSFRLAPRAGSRVHPPLML